MDVLKGCKKRTMTFLKGFGVEGHITKNLELAERLVAIADDPQSNNSVIVETIKTGNGTIKYFIESEELSGILHDFRNTKGFYNEYNLRFMDIDQDIKITKYDDKNLGIRRVKITYKLADKGEICSFKQRHDYRDGGFRLAIVGFNFGNKVKYVKISESLSYPYDENYERVDIEQFNKAMDKVKSPCLPQFITRVTKVFAEKVGITLQRYL